MALDGERTKVWRGTHNVYVQPLSPLIDVLQTAYGSSEAGSVRIDPLIYDPLQWRLLPGSPGQGAGPEGRDIGADVDRVAKTATGEEYQPAEQGQVPADAVAAAASPSEIDPSFLAAVAALPAEDQIVAVGKKLAEVNAAAEPLQMDHKIEVGQVTDLTLADDRVVKLWPLAALPSLRRLDLRESLVTDLSPLAELELRSLDLRLTLYNQAGERLLRETPSIAAIINGQATAEFWAARDAHRKEIEDLPKQIETYRAAGLTFTAEQQIEIVRRKLRELNPGFDGEFGYVAEEANVVEVYLNAGNNANPTATALWDLSPVRGLPLLKKLQFGSTGVCDLSPLAGMPLTSLYCADGTGLSDLSPLAGMPLTSLDCSHTVVSDFSPLKGMPLTYLACNATPVSDLLSLKGMALTTLYCQHTSVSDLSPLAGMALTSLHCGVTLVSDLSPLTGMPLTYLACHNTSVSNLSPLAGMPLTSLTCGRTQVSDLSPLAGMPLVILACSQTSVSDLSPLVEMPLGQLSLQATHVDDAGLMSLRQLASLTTLGLNGSRVTAAGVAELQAALPNCKIEWSPPEAAPP